MKNMRKMIPAIAMLLVSAVMLTTASYAWFTIGTTATAEGMQVTAAATSSLLIIDEKSTVNSSAAAQFDRADNTIEFAAVTGALLPATADGDSTVGLKYPKTTALKTEDESSQGVNHLTGVYTGDWTTATEADENKYYIDYVAYIASAGAAMEDYDLSVTVTFDAITNLPVYNATTVAFWVADTAEGTATKVGTLNAETGLGGDADDKVVELGTYDIPVAPSEETEGNYIVVIMRVYIDGDLEDADKAGSKYVRNSQIDLTGTGYGFDVFFQAEKAAESEAESN